MRRRSLDEAIREGDRARFDPALGRLAALRRSADGRLRGWFDERQPRLIARAPARLDVMGGIADYSGSLVLELPLSLSTFAILQARDAGEIEIATCREDGPHFHRTRLDLLARGELADPALLGARLREEGEGWAAYVVGVVQLCARLLADGGAGADRGFRLLIHSEVPEGKGISSSAALEVATMAVVCAHFGIDIAGEELAAACQWVENHVVGAPCGIMDQLTSTVGRPDRLLRLRCQPARVEAHLEIPDGYRFFGIDSGVRHAVSGADYSTVRAAAFMGYRIIADAAGLHITTERDRVAVEDPRWHGYLANLSPEELREVERTLPERITGSEFLRRYGGHTDPTTVVQASREYPVRPATRHPVMENARVERFAELLGALGVSADAAPEMGRLMYESHESYGACGLGSAGTDRLVEMVRKRGPAAGLFGAKITGGGSGGTVAVLATREAEAEVRSIAARYAAETGRAVDVFAESGPGAMATGVLEVRGKGEG